MAQQGGEKTERATPKKRREARERGQIIKSHDLVTALSLLLIFLALSAFGYTMVNGLSGLLKGFLGAGASLPKSYDIASMRSLLGGVVLRMAYILLIPLAAAFLGALVFNYLQVGFLFSTKAAAPKFSRINMIEGFKRIFSRKTLVELLKSILRLAILVKVGYDQYMLQVQMTPQLMRGEVALTASQTMEMLLSMGFKLAIALAVFAPFDYLYQWWSYERELRMTKQELRDEYKLTEGNPQTKSRIRQKQRQMSGARMMQAVAEADVVITNPTHFAVALSYKEGVNKAPVVVAKGTDYLAKKIRERAAELRIAVVENRELARGLYFFCDINQEVPEDMYQAVAEVLAYVYRLKHRVGRRARA
ncbi:MAG: flagellar biosynthesis protein FlhB [Clostridiaceae bacterium]|nr:flagellar biosynthesis protein FlhB [Eubacteriales bacterium]